MTKHKNQSLSQYLDRLSSKDPAPGGGSAAALVSALGVALISMTARYSQGKNQTKAVVKRIKVILTKSEKIRKRLLELVDLDAQAYLAVVKTRNSNKKQKEVALKKARAVPSEVCKLSYAAIQLTPFLVKNGNKHLISDVKCAVEMLSAGFHAAVANVQANQ